MHLKSDLSLDRGAFELHTQLDVTLQGITALFGPSGSGKTTLLRSLAGIDRPRGSLRVGDTLWQNSKIFVPAHRRHLGYIFQEADLFAHLSVQQNLLYGYNRRESSQRRFQPDEIADFLRIRHLLVRSVMGLSGGEKQLVALGRALLSSPELLLMDEPLAALDLSARLTIYPLLRHIATAMRIPILYVSHALDEVARLADYMILMEKGRIAASGEITAMLTRLDLPLARSPEAEVLIEGTISAHDAAWQLTAIRFAGGTFMVPQVAATIGDAVRLRVAASDVSLSLTPAADSSIVNIFRAHVSEIAKGEIPLSLLKLDLGGAVVLARITRKSCHALGLETGSQVYAQIKGAAVLV